MPSDWERITGDPELLSEARVRYRGRGDVADQLWWMQHPGTAGPSGAPDPEAQLRTAARRMLYRRDATATDAAALTREQEQEEADRVLAHQALLDAVGVRRAPVAASPEGTASAPTGIGRAGTARAPVTARLLVAVVVAATLLVTGVLIGRAWSDTPAMSSMTGQAYAVLRGKQQPLDRIPDDVRPGFVRPASTRMIAHYWSIGTDVYAARSESGRICLVTVVLGTRSASSCTTDAAFTLAGLFIQVEASADPVDDSGRVPARQIGLLWLKDGTLTISV